jgi:8-oxo-dGTP pyrophosphatase MutT (NUDIX family)
MKQKLWKICMCGVIKCGEEFLVLKRTDDDEDMPGVWEFPGGNAECGEDLLYALVREIKEETGIDIKKEETKILSLDQYESEKTDYIKCSVQINFLCEFQEKPIVNVSEEHTDFAWVTKTSDKLDEFLLNIVDKM